MRKKIKRILKAMGEAGSLVKPVFGMGF